MVYECETCETVLAPGLIACPRCGQIFDEPVPDDAVAAEPPILPKSAQVVSREEAPSDTPLELLEPVSLPARRTSRPWSRGKTVALAILMVGLCWFGYHYWVVLPVSQPVAATLPAPLTDLAAHPQYASNMDAFVQKLRATGVGAQWPAFRSNDVLLITLQPRVADAPAVWNSDMYRRLAQGIYGQFAQNRYESGFSETDTTACFVIVTNAAGQVMAVDFMGNLQ